MKVRVCTVAMTAITGMVALFATTRAFAQDVLVYDDQLRSGFANFSYGGGANFASTTPVHGGTAAIALAGNNFNAIGLANVGTDFNTTTHPIVHFWIHGGSAGNQPVRITLQTTDGGGNSTEVASAPLATYIDGGAIVAGQWREVTVRIGEPPLSYAGAYDRIDLQYEGAAPATFHVDDITLRAPATGVDGLFGHGFEDVPTSPPTAPLVIERNVVVNTMTSERYTWRDRAGQPRVAVLSHNTGQNGPNGQRGGELWEYRYETPAGQRVVRSTGQFAGGFGYVVSHRNEGTTGIAGDDSPLGHGFTGAFTRVFEGRHHAILRFTQNYPRHSRTTAAPPNTRYDVPVTIEWVVATGRDHPLWSITWDLTGVPVDALNDDSRAPYGELLFDGAASAGAHAVIAGVGWGDRYKFTSTTVPVTKTSEWTWNVANTVPYVKLWTTTSDATMGIVQTQPITQQDAGGYFGTDRWNTTSAAGFACTVGGNNYRMPCDYNWPYQSINYSLGGTSATNNTRLAWGTNFGWLGQSSYAVHGSAFWGGPLPTAFASGWPKKSYSTRIVLDRHSVAPVEAEVSQIEAVQQVAATAAVGAVATAGRGGVNRTDLVTYAPVGWNHVRAAWAFTASGNALDANLAVGNGATLRAPMLIVSNWTSASPPATVRFNGTSLVADADYFASVRADVDELWLTLARDATGGTNRIEIAP